MNTSLHRYHFSLLKSKADKFPKQESEVSKIASAPQESPEEISKRKLYTPLRTAAVESKPAAPESKTEPTAPKPLFPTLLPNTQAGAPAAAPSIFNPPAGGLFGSVTTPLFSGTITNKPQEGGVFGYVPAAKPQEGGLFGTTTNKPETQQTGSIFGGGIFGAGSSLFGTSTLQPGSFGSNIQVSNPFANYNLANQQKKDEGDSEDEGGEEEKRPPSPETFKAAGDKSKAEAQKIPAMSLEPSPYIKLVSVCHFLFSFLSANSGPISA